MLKRLWSRLRGERRSDLEEEIELHLELQIARNIELGLPPEEARRAARRSFGSVDRFQEEVLEQYPTRHLADLGRDVQYGARALLRSPISSISAGLALMLGIGLTTLMFSIVYSVVLRGLPFDESERLVFVARTHAQNPDNLRATVHDYFDWRARQHVFQDLAAFRRGDVNLRVDQNPDRYEAAFVTYNLFALLRVSPEVGRGITAADDRPGAPAVVLLSQRVWRERYAANRAIIGQAVRVNGEAATIVGVMPERFGFPTRQDVWLPLRADPLRSSRNDPSQLSVVGRLADGVSLASAGKELSAIANTLAVTFPASNHDVGARVGPLLQLLLPQRIVTLLFALLGAVALVLVIACANAANVILSRNVARMYEVSLCAALGASRFRIVRQFLIESLLLALAGAGGGLAIAAVGARLFTLAIAPTSPPSWIEIGLHPGVLVFALVAAMSSALIAGALPAIHASNADARALLATRTRGGSIRIGRLSRTLVVVEIALSVGLLVGAGLLIRSVILMRTADPGFQVKEIFTTRLTLPERDYPDKAARQRFAKDLQGRLEQETTLESVALTTALPGTSALEGTNYRTDREGSTPDQEPPFAFLAHVTSTFFDVFDVAAMQGRVFTANDESDHARVALVTPAFSRREFPDGAVLGRRLQLSQDSSRWLTIVGIVPDLHFSGLAVPDPPTVYVPFAQGDPADLLIVARTRGAPLAVTPAVHRAVSSIDPELPLFSTLSLEQNLTMGQWFYWIFGSLYLAFGAAALLLAAVGLYGVMATGVRQRRIEIGVRMALGARPGDVIRLVLREGMLQLALGMAVGLLFAAALSRLVSHLLFQVPANDVVTFGVTVLVLAAAALTASLVPALSAARVQPIDALRHD